MINILLPQNSLGQRFKAAALIGINAAQIDGDSLFGYKKTGFHLGGRLSYVNNKSFDIALEMLYSQRGASREFSNNRPNDVISANYVEIPLVFNIRDWFNTEKKYHKVRAEFGISYAYLINVESTKYDINKFSKNDVSWFLGSGIRFSPLWGVALRYTSSLSNMYKDPDGSIERFKSYFITFRSEFYF